MGTMESSFKTIEEVAASTGVSITTVRLVLNGQAERYRISAATRKRVEAYVEEHEVLINHAARSLKLQRSDTIGLVVPHLENAFFARLMSHLESCCREHGLMLLTASSHEDPGQETHAIRSLLARGVDGMVIAPCQTPDRALFAPYLKRVGVILVDRAYAGAPFPLVASNHREGARQLTQRLREQSGDDLLFLCAKPRLPSIRERIQGFQDAFGGVESDWRSRIRIGGADLPAMGAGLVRALLQERGRLPRAMMCSSLMVLEGALEQLKTEYGQIPQDLLIGNFDTEPMLGLIPNRVVSVIQDEAGLARTAFARLTAQSGAESTRVTRDIIACHFSA